MMFCFKYNPEIKGQCLNLIHMPADKARLTLSATANQQVGLKIPEMKYLHKILAFDVGCTEIRIIHVLSTATKYYVL